MAIKSFNSIAGFSVNDNSGNTYIIIDGNGDVTTANITVSNSANLGSVSNVIITGGTANYVLTTDGAGNLSWAEGGGGTDSGLMPFYIPAGQTYTISQYRQGLFSIPITIDGDLVVDGILVQV
jgi:hypothetical protein